MIRKTEFVRAFMLTTLSALLACVLIVDLARANEKILPDCVHWPTTFVFAEVLDRARVKGDSGERLYLHPVNPQLCLAIDSQDCKARAYIIPNDVGVLGHICGAWAYVMFPGGKRRSEGWVELDRLERLPSDRDLVYARKKWNHKPEGPRTVLASFVGDVAGLRRAISSDPDTLKKRGVVALYTAARQNHFDATKALPDLGVNPNDGDGCAQVGHVAAHNSVEILELLVQQGADINCKPGGQ